MNPFILLGIASLALNLDQQLGARQGALAANQISAEAFAREAKAVRRVGKIRRQASKRRVSIARERNFRQQQAIIRQAARATGQNLLTREASGASGSSAFQGTRASIRSTVGSDVGFLTGAQAASDEAFRKELEADKKATEANIAAGRASLKAQKEAIEESKGPIGGLIEKGVELVGKVGGEIEDFFDDIF